MFPPSRPLFFPPSLFLWMSVVLCCSIAFFVVCACVALDGSQVGVDGDGQTHLTEMSADGVSYEPVGVVEGLADDAMEHGGMRDLATVSRLTVCTVQWLFVLRVRSVLWFAFFFCSERVVSGFSYFMLF